MRAAASWALAASCSSTAGDCRAARKRSQEHVLDAGEMPGLEFLLDEGLQFGVMYLEWSSGSVALCYQARGNAAVCHRGDGRIRRTALSTLGVSFGGAESFHRGRGSSCRPKSVVYFTPSRDLRRDQARLK